MAEKKRQQLFQIACTYVNDFNTQELGRALLLALYERSGCYPNLVLNRLHRRKLDANRDLGEAADGSIQRLELGYRHTKTELQLSDAVLNLPPYPTVNSIRKLRYGSYNGGVLNGVQIECNRNGVFSKEKTCKAAVLWYTEAGYNFFQNKGASNIKFPWLSVAR